MYCMPNMCERIIENQVSHWKGTHSNIKPLERQSPVVTHFD